MAKSSTQGIRVSSQPKEPSALYSFIMTPINLTVFLVSLLIVDMRYTKNRVQTYGYTHLDLPWWYPRWVAQYIWPQPYQHIGRTDKGKKTNERWHYHTKQKKLMKMEADEAFEMRSTILVILFAVLAFMTCATWYTGSMVYRWLGDLASASPTNQSMST